MYMQVSFTEIAQKCWKAQTFIDPDGDIQVFPVLVLYPFGQEDSVFVVDSAGHLPWGDNLKGENVAFLERSQKDPQFWRVYITAPATNCVEDTAQVRGPNSSCKSWSWEKKKSFCTATKIPWIRIERIDKANGWKANYFSTFGLQPSVGKRQQTQNPHFWQNSHHCCPRKSCIHLQWGHLSETVGHCWVR